MKDKEKQKFEFKVIDNNTGKEADIGKIALKEDWAKGLMYCDMQGFAITEDNHLILLDECGKYEFCPSDRFAIIYENSVVLSKEEYDRFLFLSKVFDNGIANELINMQEKLDNLKKELKRTNKETVEKILNELNRLVNKNAIKVTRDDYECCGFIYMIDCGDISIFLDKFAKQFGVEIKE